MLFDTSHLADTLVDTQSKITIIEQTLSTVFISMLFEKWVTALEKLFQLRLMDPIS